MTRHQLAHMEAAANVIAGIVLTQLILFIYGMSMREAAAWNGVFLVVSYIRSFVIRLLFARLTCK